MSLEAQFSALGFNLYDEIGANPRTSSRDDIEALYKVKVRRLHSDLGGSDDAMIRLNQARDFLSDAEVRAAYDRWLDGTSAEPQESRDPFDDDDLIDADIGDPGPPWPPTPDGFPQTGPHTPPPPPPPGWGKSGLNWWAFSGLWLLAVMTSQPILVVPPLIYTYGWGSRSQRYRVSEVVLAVLAVVFPFVRSPSIGQAILQAFLTACAASGAVWLELHYRRTSVRVSEKRLL